MHLQPTGTPLLTWRIILRGTYREGKNCEQMIDDSILTGRRTGTAGTARLWTADDLGFTERHADRRAERCYDTTRYDLQVEVSGRWVTVSSLTPLKYYDDCGDCGEMICVCPDE